MRRTRHNTAPSETAAVSQCLCLTLENNDFHLLQLAARQAAAAATQTIAAAQNAAASNKNTVAHQHLVHSCKVMPCNSGFISLIFSSFILLHFWCFHMQAVADSIPQLVQGMRSSQAQPEELGAQLALIMASQSFLQVRPAANIEVLLLLAKTQIKQIHSPFSLEARW